MTDTVMPCFVHHPEEGMIIGRLLTGYGELELEMCNAVGAALKSKEAAIRAFFNARGEDRRIKMARSNLKKPALAAGLEALSEQVLDDMAWCKEIRNQYAHCQWAGNYGECLGFVNLEDVALLVGDIWPLTAHRLDLNLPLLNEQERFFVYVRNSFWHLAYRFESLADTASSHVWPTPPTVARPRKHM
jgi:hypothetical protein